jgi:Uma2 family endonuclease
MPRVALNVKPMTFEEYLQLEEKHEIRHEFVDGFMFAMAGASDEHNLISLNIATAARAATRNTNCRAYHTDMKLRTPNGIGYYPDVFITCDDDDKGKKVKQSPCLIVEVLSPSTEDIDRGEKWLNYQKSSSLKMFVLVRQDKKFLEIYKRNPDGTWQYTIFEESGTLEFSCVDFSMTLEEIYEDVIFENNPRT